MALQRALTYHSRSSLHTKSAALLHGRNAPPTYQYEQLSQIELDIEPFEDESAEQHRSESDLQAYFTRLRAYLQRRRYARPRYRLPDRSRPKEQPLFKPLYDYSKTKTTETDTRPSYYKFMEQMQQQNPQLFAELNDPIPTEDLIDMNYLNLHENRHVPTIMPDDEYPDWVWELVPESRKYWWTDLVQTPFENLSEVEKFRLLGKWRKTLMVSNNQWTKSHLGRLGDVRPEYNDPWPSPLTKMDIARYQQNDEFYQESKQLADQRVAAMKGRKRMETDTDVMYNQNMMSGRNELVLDEYGETAEMDVAKDGMEFEEQVVDLAQYYGLDDSVESVNVDRDYSRKYGVVYDVARKDLDDDE